MAYMATSKAVSYIRVSGKGQADGDGPERQRLAIARFAKSNSYEVIEEYSDLGVSGTTELSGRPGLAALLDRIESNGVRMVIVERADRLARDLMVQEVIVAQFIKAGGQLLTSDGVNLTSGDGDPTRRLIRQVLGAVAEFEKNVLVLKLRAARERVRKREGRCEGRKPYGTHPSERAVVDRMRQLRRKPPKGAKSTLGEVAAALNAEGHRNRSGREWSTQMVHHVLMARVKPDAAGQH